MNKKNKKNKKTSNSKPQPVPLTRSKKRIFWIITISFPFILLILLETALRLFNYDGNLKLFIPGPAGYENYLRPNPNTARRYFSVQTAVPTPPNQLFLKEKPQNGFRIFVMGESSAAGFPYSSNASFPGILRRALENTFPDKHIEVINISMSAINTYTLLDLTSEILDQSPDLLLIYTGHNEYYGALGVGSTQSMGNSGWLVRSYLKLQSFKTVLLLRDIMGWTKVNLSRLFTGGSEVDPSATLMDRMVAEQTIPLGSSLYEAGREQFKENMSRIIEKARSKGVKIILSELVSNLKNQVPFVSVGSNKEDQAKYIFSQARNYEAEGDYDNARKYYKKAKDLDALRFRAPEEFNRIINNLAKEYSIPAVPAVSYFEKASPHGLIGSSLMLEHLHPNINGYYLLAKAFYDTMKKEGLIESVWPKDGIAQEKDKGVTELDSVYGAIVVRHLKAGWPFQPKNLPNRFLETFHPANRIEETAIRILPGKNFNLEAAHMELGEYYERLGMPEKSLAEYNALIASIPTEIEFYQKAAMLLIKEKEFMQASDLLQKSLRYKENNFANKWIGQIALMNNNYKDAVFYLTKAEPGDPQVIFNLSRAYYLNNDWYKGEESFTRLRTLAPQSPYLPYLNSLRTSIKLKDNLANSK